MCDWEHELDDSETAAEILHLRFLPSRTPPFRLACRTSRESEGSNLSERGEGRRASCWEDSHNVVFLDSRRGRLFWLHFE